MPNIAQTAHELTNDFSRHPGLGDRICLDRHPEQGSDVLPIYVFERLDPAARSYLETAIHAAGMELCVIDRTQEHALTERLRFEIGLDGKIGTNASELKRKRPDDINVLEPHVLTIFLFEPLSRNESAQMREAIDESGLNCRIVDRIEQHERLRILWKNGGPWFTP